MTNLTEQWKKGELPDGRYWVKYRSGRINDWDLSGGKVIEMKPEIVEVLASVTSFEQCQQLKELLKECREHLITYKRDELDKGYVVYDGSYLINKINQVLGEE